MKRFAIVALLGAAVLAGSTLYEQPKASADDDECKPAGKCPLHDWMDKELQGPMDAGDLKKVAAGFEKLAGLAPDPKWNDGATGWKKIATDGATAAKAGDAKAAGAACKSCHKTWRKEYKEKFRSKPVK